MSGTKNRHNHHKNLFKADKFGKSYCKSWLKNMEDKPLGVPCKKKVLQNYKYRDKLSEQTNNVPKHSGYDESVERLQ
jgi:hypothetical protein